MRKHTAILGASALLVLGACSGKQVAEDEPGIEQTDATTRPTPTPSGPSAEELEAQRLAEADEVFAEATRLFRERGGDAAGRIERLLTEAMEKNADYTSEAWFNIGVVRYAAGDESGAIEAYREAGEADELFARGMANIGYLQMIDGEYAAATATFNECIARLETEPGCNINLAVLYSMGEAPYEGDLRSAMITRYRFALGGDAHNADAYANLSQIYYEQGQYELARMTCENAILLGIDEAVLHNRLGLIALKLDDVIGAYQEFQRAVELDPDFYEAWVNIGAMALSFRDYEAGAAAFERVLSAHPEDEDVRLSYGAALRGLEQPEAAESEYEAVLAAHDEHPGALYNMGLLYQEAYQDYPAACGYYIRYLDASPRDAAEYADAERRLFSLHSLLESLVFLGEGTPEDAEACVR